MYIYLRNLWLRIQSDLYILLQFTFIFSLTYFLVFFIPLAYKFYLFPPFFSILLFMLFLIYRVLPFSTSSIKHPIFLFTTCLFYSPNFFVLQFSIHYKVHIFISQAPRFLFLSLCLPPPSLSLFIYLYNSPLTIILCLLIR